MGMVGGYVGYKTLRLVASRDSTKTQGAERTDSGTTLVQAFGQHFLEQIEGKTVIDFGCGPGKQSIEIARKTIATKVIGIDIQEHLLERGRQTAKEFGVTDRCTFATRAHELADVVISKDAFEHFSDPASVLNVMSTLIKPTGSVLAAFGPTWLHPYGGHLFSVFPWSHLIFSEHAQIRWRRDFKSDGATRLSEVAGGLNQLTIGNFEKIVARSSFKFEWFDTVPIRGITLLKSKFLREIGSSIVRCKLVLK